MAGYERVRKYNKTFFINNVQLSVLAVSNITSFPGNLLRAAHSILTCAKKFDTVENAPKKQRNIQ